MQDGHYHLVVLLIKASLLLGAFLVILFLITKSKLILSLCKKYLPLRFILGSMFFLVMSQAIDTLELGYKFLILVEELSEMNLALSLLFVCFSLSYPVLNKDKVSRVK